MREVALDEEDGENADGVKGTVLVAARNEDWPGMANSEVMTYDL